MADLSKSIRMSVESGKVIFGSRQAVSCALNGNAKVIVVSSSAPKKISLDVKSYAKVSGIPVIEFPGPSKELGSICGMPYLVSAMAILNVGNSDLLSFAKQDSA